MAHSSSSAGFLSDEQLERALDLQAETGDLLGEILVTEFGISRIELASVLAEQWAELEQEHARARGDQEPTSMLSRTPPSGTAVKRKRIGEIFSSVGYVAASELDAALEDQKDSGQPLGEVLIGRGNLSRLDLASALAEQWAGLEKIRPPAPKRVEGWQQVAPLEHAAAAAQGASRGVAEAPSEEPRDTSLADAVAALAERVAAVEARGSSSTGADEVAGLRATLDELREHVSAPSSELEDVARRLEAVEETGAIVESIGQRLETLETQDEDRSSRRDLEGVSAGLSFRLEALDTQLKEAVAGAKTGLDSVVSTLGELQERIDTLVAAPQPSAGEHEVIVEFATRLDELAGAIPAVDELTARLAALEAAGSGEASLRDEVVALQMRLDELATSGSTTDGLADRLAALEAAGLGGAPWRDEARVLHARLEELASSGPRESTASSKAVGQALAGRAGSHAPWRDEVRVGSAGAAR